MHQLPEALRSADQQARAAAAGQNDMFGLDAPGPKTRRCPRAVELDEWPERVLLSSEKEALGLYLTGHPFDAVRADARCFVDGALGQLAAEPPPTRGERDYSQSRREVTIAGLVMDVRKARKSRQRRAR